jgi:cation diffusion facilitator CzcD-associated flavoprotein CzcO
MAAYMGMLCPGRSYRIIEGRARLGGTWDLFRYPGIRSDSDMHTLGFSFEPWPGRDAIASGDAIRRYLEGVAARRGILQHIRFGTRVAAADFRRDEGRWHVTLEDGSGLRSTVTASFLYLAAGYYDYAAPHDPPFPGREEFAGAIVHPQFWPADLDYEDKRVVIIGSGATAVTLVPAIAGNARHVTMLQRTPTWMGARPSRDRLGAFLRLFLPRSWAAGLVRRWNIRVQDFIYRQARAKPHKIAHYLTRKARQALGPHYNETDWLPPYGPWEQRLCLVPNGDLFAAIRQGKASIATDRIDRFDRTGILLESGRHLDADIIVTATGLRLAMAGNIRVTMDGQRLRWRDQFYYRSCMFSNVPNLAVVFGYLNASWTLRAEATARYICAVLNHMAATGSSIATPRLADADRPEAAVLGEFSSGYIQRALPLMPKSASTLPWRLNQDYREDCRDFRDRPVDDGILAFEQARWRATKFSPNPAS